MLLDKKYPRDTDSLIDYLKLTLYLIKINKIIVIKGKIMVKVQDLKFSLIYADDFEKTKSFYVKHFDFKESFEMPDTELGPQTWGMTGSVGMWIGGGHTRTNRDDRSARSGVMFGIDSAFTLLQELKADDVQIFQEEPIEMQPGVFWFQFEDPSGNIIEILGGK